jgi:hypothetical protein
MTEPRVAEVSDITEEEARMLPSVTNGNDVQYPALPPALDDLEPITQAPSNRKGKGKANSNNDTELDSKTQARSNHGSELDSRTKAGSSRDDEAAECPPGWTCEQVEKTPPYLLPLESDKLDSYEKLLKDLVVMNRPTTKKIFAKIVMAGIWDTSHELWSNKLAGQHLIHPDSVNRLVATTRRCGVDINEDRQRRWNDLATKAYAGQSDGRN